MTDGRDEDAVARFVERLALVLVEAGMQRMPARVFTALLATDNGKATAGEMSESLRVSPAAISGAVRYLTQVNLIVRGRDPGERRDHYEVVDDLWYEAFVNRSKFFDSFATVLSEGVEAVGADSKAGARLDLTRRFMEFLKDNFMGLMQQWRDQEAAQGR